MRGGGISFQQPKESQLFMTCTTLNLGDIAKLVYRGGFCAINMSAMAGSGRRFTYGLGLALSMDLPSDEEASKRETQNFVNATLGLMTAGCEQCEYSKMLFCEKLKRPVKVRDTRCEFFMRRPTAFLKDLV